MYVISLIHFFKRLNPNFVEHWLGFRDSFSGRDTLHVVFIDARLASAWRYSPVRIGTKERQFEKTLTKEQSNDAVSAARLGLSLVLNLATLTRGFAQSLFHLQNGMVWEAKTVSFTWFKGLTYELFFYWFQWRKGSMFRTPERFAPGFWLAEVILLGSFSTPAFVPFIY